MRARLAALMALAACDGNRTVAVDLRGLTADLAVVLTLDGNGAPVRLSPPFGLSEGAVTYGRPPTWQLEGSEESMVAVGWSQAALLDLYGRFAPRDAEAAVLLAAPPDRARLDPRAPLDEPWLATAAGPNAFVVAAGGPTGAIESIDAYPSVQANLRLRLPVDPEPCPPRGEPRLYPFAAELDGALDDLGLDRSNQRLLHAAPLDRRTALVAGPGLWVIERGQRARPGRPTHDAPDVWVPGDRLWPNGRTGNVPAIALMAPDGSGTRRGVIAAQGRAGGAGWIHEITVGPAGVQLVQTLATIERDTFADIDLDAAGNFIAVTEDGRVLLGALDSPDQAFVQVGPDITEGIAVRWTGEIPTPAVVGADRAVFVARADFQGWSRREASVVGERAEVSELTRLPARNEVWASGSRSLLLVRRGPSEWAELSLSLPPRFEPCAVPDTDLDALRSLRHVDAIAGGDGYVYLSQENCNAVLAVRAADQCVAVLTPDGRPARAIKQQNDDDKQLRGAAYADGQLLMVGDEGRILTNLPE